jgi:hypothetical protein
VAIPKGPGGGNDVTMPILAAARPVPVGIPRRAIAFSALMSIGFIGGGLLIGWFALGTGFVQRFMAPRPTEVQMAAGGLAWTFALVAPAVFLIVGMAKLVDTIELIDDRRQRPRPAARIAGDLSADHVVASRVRLPDGRIVPELVIGPFGVAVVEELPPPRASRHRDGRWEVRLANGAWTAIESPLDRAGRDAERVRGWLAHEDHDHVVKVYATVVAADASVARTPSCAVVSQADLGAWLASLPAQRSLYPERRARIVELIHENMA